MDKCRKGLHFYDEKNTRINIDGSRTCRACLGETRRARYRRNKLKDKEIEAAVRL